MLEIFSSLFPDKPDILKALVDQQRSGIPDQIQITASTSSSFSQNSSRNNKTPNHPNGSSNIFPREGNFREYRVGMARGIPRPSILEVPDLFSLLDSPRNRFYNSSAPRFLAKIRRGPRKYRISFLNTSKMKISENFQQFVKNFLFLFLFFSKKD